MKQKSATRTSDYLPWDSAMQLIQRLYRDGQIRMSLLVGCGCFFGLRISDLLSLKWHMLLDDEKFLITEKKTGKIREIKINEGFRAHILKCQSALSVTDDTSQSCFISRKHTVYSTQRINTVLKDLKKRYRLPIDHFSTHSFRKTFGRRVVESSGENAEMALIKLSEIFNHATPKVTRVYLGMRQEELLSCYDMLDF